MKKFRLKLNSLVISLLIVVTIVSLVGAGWNIYNIFAKKNILIGNIISYALICLATLVVSALAISILLFGGYSIKKDNLILYFGFIPSKIKISEIVAITHFKKTDKLVVYFSDAKYSVILISNKDYDLFINTLRDINSKISYDNQIEGEDLPS